MKQTSNVEFGLKWANLWGSILVSYIASQRGERGVLVLSCLYDTRTIVQSSSTTTLSSSHSAMIRVPIRGFRSFLCLPHGMTKTPRNRWKWWWQRAWELYCDGLKSWWMLSDWLAFILGAEGLGPVSKLCYTSSYVVIIINCPRRCPIRRWYPSLNLLRCPRDLFDRVLLCPLVLYAQQKLLIR